MESSTSFPTPPMLSSIYTESQPYECSTRLSSQPLPVDSITRPQMNSNSSSVSSWLPVTFSPCHTKYSWNPYLKTPTDGDMELSKNWYKQSNVPFCCAPFPISESTQRGYDKTKGSVASSSTQESPALTARAFGHEETPPLVPRNGASPQSPGIGGECIMPAVLTPYYMDEYFIVDNNSGSRIDDIQQSTPIYALPPAVTDTWPFCETTFEEQLNMDGQTKTGIEQHQIYPSQAAVQKNQRNPGHTPSYLLRTYPAQQDTASGFSGIGQGQQSSSSSSLAIASHRVLRFKKMFPPPLQYDEALNMLKGNCQYPELSVALLLLRWYERLELLQKEFFDTRGTNNAANINNTKRSCGVLERCPSPPPETNQTNQTIREWAIKCNMWWEKEFDEKSRSTEGGRGWSGRYRERHHGSHLHWSGSSSSNKSNCNGGSSNGGGRGRGSKDAPPRQGGRFSR